MWISPMSPTASPPLPFSCSVFSLQSSRSDLLYKSDHFSIYSSTVAVRVLAYKQHKLTLVFLLTYIYIHIQRNILERCRRVPSINHSWSTGPGLSFSINGQAWILLLLWLPWEPITTVGLHLPWLSCRLILPSPWLQNQRSMWESLMSPALIIVCALAAVRREQNWLYLP